MSAPRGSAPAGTAIAFRDPLAGRRMTAPRGLRGLGASLPAQIGAGAAATGATFAAGSAIAAGAAFGSVVPVVGTAIGALVGLASTFLGGGTPDAMKNIWDVVPFSVIRITGGHGQWSDPLTHETLTDAQTDLRKAAVVCSAIGAFNSPKNWWYDQATQGYLNGAACLQRWQARFGSLSFANAYAAYPSAFSIYSPVSNVTDPQIHEPSAPSALVTPTAAIGPINTLPLPNTAVAKPPLAVQQASILGGLSGNTALLLGGGLIVGLILMGRRSSRGDA